MDVYKKVLLATFVAVGIFTFGFISRGFFIKNQTPTPNTRGVKNIALPNPKEGKYKVIEVVDGDTITLETGEKLRYLGIDTPEVNERWGPEAKSHNTDLVLNKMVKIELDRVKIDKYGRILGYVWVDSVLVNEALVERGYATINLMKNEAKPKYLDRLQRAQNWAQQNHDGIWFDEWVRNQPTPTNGK